MAREMVYGVAGNGEVRLQLFAWPAAGWLAVVQSSSQPLLLHLTQDRTSRSRMPSGATSISTISLQGRFDGQFGKASRLSANVMGQEQYMQVLDVARSVKERGKQFCFVKTIFAEEGKWFPKPRVSNICYPRGRK